jgi:hypothetical protein
LQNQPLIQLLPTTPNYTQPHLSPEYRFLASTQESYTWGEIAGEHVTTEEPPIAQGHIGGDDA